MNVSFPFEGETAASLFSANEKGVGGFFPVGVNNFWHGGIHLTTDKPVRAIADGVLIAYRMNKELQKCKVDNKEYKYSSSFVLLRQELNTSDGFSLVIYSLSMHLLPLSKYSDAQMKRAPAFLPRKYSTKTVLTRRKEPRKEKGNELGTLPKDTVLNFKNAADLTVGWQELAEGGYVYFSDTFVSTSVEPPEYDKVVNVNPPIAIQQGELLGYCGTYMDTEKVVHIEVFTDSVTFLDNPKKIRRGPKTLKIPQGTSFKSKEPDVDKLIVNLTAGSRLKLIEQDKSSDARKVSCVDIVGWVKKGVLGPYDGSKNSYPLKEDISSMYIKVPSSATDTPPLVNVTAKKNDLVRYLEKNGDFRRIGISFKEKKEGWAHKNDLGKFSSSQYTLANPLNELLSQNPTIAFKFEKVAGQNAQEILVEEWRAQAAALKTHKNETWYELEHEPGKKGWIKSDDPKITALSDYDWPGWIKVQESGQYSKDGLCDVEGLIKLIDKEEKTGPQPNAPKAKDGKLTVAEIKAAVQDARIGPMLHKLACLHPTEWDAGTDQSMDKWKRLKERPWSMSEQSYQDTLKYIKTLQWWSDVDKKNMPADASKIWHVHPVALVMHIKRLAVPLTSEEKRNIVNIVAGFESGAARYAAVNRDFEFEGYFDLPDEWYKDKTKAAPDTLNPKVPYSKYSGQPRHVGLSFGFIQFTQEGPLGRLVQRMYDADQAKFKEVFGEHWEELLKTLGKQGDSTTADEEIFDNTEESLGKKQVRRAPSVQPVEGHEVWDDYWVGRFQTSANHVPFQNCQEDLAVSDYMDPFLAKAKGRVLSQKSIALMYDRSVNQGMGKGIQLVQKVMSAADEQAFWTNYINSESGFIKDRLETIRKSDKASWDMIYDIE